jgi:hypothetical protein
MANKHYLGTWLPLIPYTRPSCINYTINGESMSIPVKGLSRKMFELGKTKESILVN